MLGPDGQPSNISYNEDLLPWLGGSGRSNYVGSFLLILAVSLALIVCGSALVIYNAFAISIGERKKQFGMFASAGATSAQIRRIVLTEAEVIAVIGIPLGILGAIAAGDVVEVEIVGERASVRAQHGRRVPVINWGSPPDS